MKIYDIDGNILLDVPITSAATHEEELGKSDYVRLSWVSDAKQILAVGTYIIPFEDGLKYRLLEPYTPNQNNELEWKYEPEFQHPLMWLSKIPFTYTTVDKDLQLSYTSQDWPYLGLTASLLQVVVDQINALFGFTKDSDKFTYQIIGNVDTTVNVTFSSTDILSALSAIANACTENDVEWHISWKQKCLYFGQIMFDMGEATPTLEVGKNIGKVSVTNTKDGYYNVFFPQGSTRNISTRLTNGHYLASSLRLGLNFPKYDDCKYPEGLIDTRTNKNEPKQILALTFDDVYPHVNCYVYNVRSRTAVQQENGKDKLDNNGKPIQYSIWYFRLAYPLIVQESGYIATSVLNGTTYYWYDYTIDKEKDIVDGHKLMGQFTVNTHGNAQPQPLLGQPTATEGFEFVYHEADSDLKLDDGSTVKKGDYEIVYSNNNDIIIPTTKEDGLYPRGEETPSFTANEVILYNIVLTEQEIRASQDELLTKTQKEIARRNTDLNNYSFPSYPDVFENENPNLYIGKKVIFHDGVGNTLATRVIRLSTKIDYPFEQQITVGNQKIKGVQSQLREDVKTIMSGNWSGGGLNDTQVKNLIQNYGGGYFLSKLNDDTAQGIITFLKGILLGDGAHGITGEGDATLNSVTGSGWGVDKDGDGTLRSLVTDIIKSTGFTSDDLLSGMGYHMYTDADGKSHVITDYLTTRIKAYFSELEIQKTSYSGGNTILSGAGNTIAYVEEVDDANGKGYKCWFLAADGEEEVENMWKVGDQALCHMAHLSTGSNMGNRYYWRLVTETGKEEKTFTNADGTSETKTMGYVVLSDADSPFSIIYEDGTTTGKQVTPDSSRAGVFQGKADSSDAPAVGDAIVALGSQVDRGRMKAVQIASVSLNGEPAPAINFFSGVNDYSMTPVFYISPDGISGKVRFVDLTITNEAGDPVQIVNFRGDWQEDFTYIKGDMVTYDGQSWLWNNADSITGTAPSEDTGWTTVARSGRDGQDGTIYQVVLTADGGTIIRAGERTKTLRARVLENGTDITSRLPSVAFSWIRRSGNDDADGIWNDAHKGVGNEITITDADVFSATQFDCVVSAEL